MKIKKALIVTMMLSAFVLAYHGQALAEKGRDQGGKFHQKSIKDKFFKKAHHILMNKEELGITEEQADKIVALKVATKKDIIMKDAEVEVIKVDVKSMLWDDPIDVKAINKLIDKKYAIKKAKAKNLVGAYAELKGSLTDAQKDMLWGMYKAKYKGSMKGSMK